MISEASLEKLRKRIVYIAHPWTFNPDKSFLNAVDWIWKLREMGFYPFSPISHTHPYWKKQKVYTVYSLGCENDDCDAFMTTELYDKYPIPDKVKCACCEKELVADANHLEGEKIKQYLEKEDWLDWDLKIIKGFMNDDGGVRGSLFFNSPIEIIYDTGIFVLMSRTAFHKSVIQKNGKLITIGLEWEQYIKDPENYGFGDNDFQGGWNDLWESQGCRQEYEFAKKNYIQIFELEAFLKGRLKEL